MNILLVEDDDFVARPISEIVVRWGHHIQWSHTGKGALEKMRRTPFDLILLDIFLPDVHGHELIHALKEIRPQVGIVTMTGNNSRELESKVRKEGIIYYMIKPFQMTILKEILDHVSKRSKQAVKGT